MEEIGVYVGGAGLVCPLQTRPLPCLHVAPRVTNPDAQNRPVGCLWRLHATGSTGRLTPHHLGWLPWQPVPSLRAFPKQPHLQKRGSFITLSSGKLQGFRDL